MKPEFSTVEPYVRNFLRSNYWKVETLMPFEDALSEARLQFVRTVDRLNKRDCEIKNEKHLMALFKTSWSNHFITLTNKATNERFVQTLSNPDSQDLMLDSLIGDVSNMGELDVLLHKAPSEIKQVLTLLINSPIETIEVIRSNFFTNKAKSNSLLCSLLGKNPSTTNLVQKTLDYLEAE